jgi:hypothetical protein
LRYRATSVAITTTRIVRKDASGMTISTWDI